MRHYYRTLSLVAVALSLLLVMMLSGCQQSAKPAEAGGGSIDMSTGRVTVGGCVISEVK